jgi:hypothetical protein
MYYIIEALLVGIYSVFIYLLFSRFIYKNLYVLLLVVGFFKHFLGSSLGLHTWYCNNGSACIKGNKNNKNKNKEANTIYLLRDSIYEALMYLFIGFILQAILTNMALFFAIGVILHILAEQLLVHRYFCRKSCSKE